jgi:2-polyprenyl-3-methyl-5-hydroxy-6-metoxy-1,4-benzoquinol methylase
MPPSNLYRSYSQWRSRGREAPSERGRRHQEALCAKEVARAGLRAGGRIFEGGFGDGHFLQWASTLGYAVRGCEIVEEFVECARAKGLDVVHGDVVQVLTQDSRQYDLLVFLDLFEHLKPDDLHRLLEACVDRLAPNGRILARFPNGASPFARASQYGDATHRCVLTSASLEQIAYDLPLRVIWAGNAARVFTLNRPASLFKPIGFGFRNLIEIVLGHVYFGRRLPMDPNLTVVLGRSHDGRDET